MPHLSLGLQIEVLDLGNGHVWDWIGGFMVWDCDVAFNNCP